MEQALIGLLSSSWPTVWLIVVWWYYMAKYFMGQIDKKDIQNQTNLDKFIALHEKTMDAVGKFSSSIDNLHPKLNEIHEDIKDIKNRK